MEASVATPGQGAPAAGAQSGAPDQGGQQGQPTAAGKGDAGFNWDLFPDVPVEQRELLEPHFVKQQGYVTKLEQQYAPYKGLTESVSPDNVDGLVQFLQSYQDDPVAVTLGIIQEQQQNGGLPQGTLEAVQNLIQQGQQGQPADQVAQPGEEEIPQWAQELRSRLDAQEQAEQEAQVQQAEQEGQQLLTQAQTDIRAGLTEAGISADQIPDQMIVAAIIAHDGDAQAAQASLSQMRQTFLAEFANGKTGGPKAATVQGDLPAPKKGSSRPKARGDLNVDMDGARQYLEQAAQAE